MLRTEYGLLYERQYKDALLSNEKKVLKGIKLSILSLLGTHVKDKSPFSNVNFGNKFQGNQNEIEPLESIPIVTREWIEHKLNQSLDSLYFPLKSTFKENENAHEPL